MTKKIYKVHGMDCASCATLLEMNLEDAGFKASCSYPKEILEIEGKHDIKEISEIVERSGFKLS
jgi:copper chaperone CopZ